MEDVRNHLPALLLGLFGACKGVPVPPPSGAENALLGIQVRIVSFETGKTFYPNRVWFARIEKGTESTQVFESSYARGQTVYLLNAAPGRYAAVAVGELVDGKTDFTYLPKECIRATEVTVEAGKSAFAGMLAAKRRVGLADRDESMAHYSGLVNPLPARESALSILFARYRNHHVFDFTVDRSPERTGRFHAEAEKHLAKAGWGDRLP